MESLKVTRYIFFLADLVLLGMAAFFTSQIILSVVVRPDINTAGGAAAGGATETLQKEVPDSQAESDVILDRNLFNSLQTQLIFRLLQTYHIMITLGPIASTRE